MSITCIVSEVPQSGTSQEHREICKTRSNPTEGTSGCGVTFLIDDDLKTDNHFMLDPNYAVRRGTRHSSNSSKYSETHSPRYKRKSIRDNGGLQRSKTLPHGNRRKSSFRADSQGSIRRPSPSTSRHPSIRHHNGSRRSMKSDMFFQRIESQRSSHTQASPTVSNLDYGLSPNMPSPNPSRSSSRVRKYDRRQSAWSGAQLRDDFDDVTSKYANPETELAVSAIVLIIGSVCLIISFGNGMAWTAIGIVLLSLGSIMLLIGILWYYKKSRISQNEAQPRAKIYDITAEQAECESMISNSSVPCSPTNEIAPPPDSSPANETA